MVLLFAVPAEAASDFGVGIEAFKRGDFTEARIQFEPLAHEGMAAAQANLGLMYSKGYGVILDYREAFQWYQLAAHQGQPVAQNNLGAMYLSGSGTPPDVIVGYMWLLLAKDGGHVSAGSTMVELERTMSDQQIEIGRGLAALWKRKIALIPSSKQP
jgi:TPR repeat protein